MKVLPDRPTRVAADLLEAAAVEGARQRRSAKQQLDHWARVGLAVSAPHTAARRRVEAALAGEVALRELSSDERSVVSAELDASISETARGISFGEVLAGRGVTIVALNEAGGLTRYHPDGSTETLD
ncbi:MAG: TA system antitoxin ParD family protein [Mycobacteriales bacterium]